MTPLLAVVATTTVGLLVGVEFAVAVVINPVALRLPTGAALAARADAARMLGRVMPFCYIGSMILTAALTAFTWDTPAATMTLTATGLLTISVAMSIVLLVPINNRAAMWTAESHPADWREQLQRWDRLHSVRVAIIVTAFVLVTIAATTL